jgi:hypothetical protein
MWFGIIVIICIVLYVLGWPPKAIGGLAILLVPSTAIGVFLWNRYKRARHRRMRDEREWARREQITKWRAARSPTVVVAKFMQSLGPDKPSRTKEIEAFFDAASGGFGTVFHFDSYDIQEPGSFPYSERRTLNASAKLKRALPAMPQRQREALRSACHLYNEGFLEDEQFHGLLLAFAFGDGQGQLIEPKWFESAEHKGGSRYPMLDIFKVDNPPMSSMSVGSLLQLFLTHYHGLPNTEVALNVVLSTLMGAAGKHPDNPVLRSLQARLVGGDELAAPPAAESKSPPLLIGLDENTGSKVFYGGQGSLVTIARAGAGKTRCHVMPNLLTWQGPAVVLDLKGELYDTTSKWRSQNVGPVYKFSPFDTTDATHAYNPLAFVRPDTDYLWQDARLVAEMMIAPSGAKEPFWENRARDVVQAAIADVCVAAQGQTPRMSGVLDILHGVGWKEFIARLKDRLDVAPMYRAGHSLDSMEAKVKDSVLQTAQTSVTAWESPQVVRATYTCDWKPEDLRGKANPTVYICVGPQEITSMLSVLRVLIAQHISVLLSGKPDPSKTILFMLDELPQLRYMAPVEQALAVGRQYGIKLWMFAQYLSQFQTAYENADGMIGNCGIRLFMNPSTADGTAQKISAEIGDQESILDGSRHRKVDPQVLAGPEYEDFVICLETSRVPYRVRKYPVDADPQFRGQMGRL